MPHRQIGLHGTAPKGSAKGEIMRFDLLDEYSTLVPFGLGVSRKAAIQHRAVPAQDCAVPAKAVKRGTIANFTSHLVSLRKLPGAILGVRP